MKLKLKKTVNNKLIINLFNFYQQYEKEFISFYELSNKVAYERYEEKARLFLEKNSDTNIESLKGITMLDKKLYVGFIAQYKEDGHKAVFGLEDLLKVVGNVLRGVKPVIIDYKKPSFKFPELRDNNPPNRSYARLWDPYI